MRRLILFFHIIAIMLPLTVFAQGTTVTGSVRDIGGVLPGASVYEKGLPSNVTSTDGNGKFKLTLRSGKTIVVKFVGYADQEVNVAGKSNVDIILSSSSQGITEVVVTGFAKTSRPTVTGAVSQISASEIRTVPTANVQNALTGRMPGFFSTQGSGQPGRDASDFFIRGVSSLNKDGNKPLIIVDDIEYQYDQLQQINVNEIETISILKDASTTAIYGIKGANGVLVVTTRRGKSGAPKFNLRVEGGLQSNTKTPTFLDSYNSATLINEANVNDGKAPTFSADDLQKFKDGSDPYGHPNVSWYNELFKKFTSQANTNLDISGGTEQVKYFISGGALIQNGLTRDFPDPQKLVNTNYSFKRYNFRSNLDVKANKSLSFRLDMTTRFSDLNQPRNLNAVGEVYDFTKITPFTAPFLNPNGSYAYAYSSFNPAHLPTLNARLATGGYDHPRRTDFNILVSGTQKLDDLTEGLSVSARIAYSSVEQFSKGTTNGGIPSYHYDPVTDKYTLKPGASYVFQSYSYIGQTDIFTTNSNLQLFANYDRTFNDTHHFTGLVLANQISETFFNYPLLASDRVGVPQRFRGVSVKVGYDYKQKYLIDFNGAYNGTDRFAADKRYGFFPAVSAAWRLSEEPFFKKAFPVFSLFKIRGSFGIVGSDAAPNNRYVYLQTYNQNGEYNFGESQNNYAAYFEGNQSNATVVWEKARKVDIGLDANMFGNKISLTLDVFRDIRYDQLITPGVIPLTLGVGLPAVNIGRTQNQGFDGQITYNGQVGKLQFTTGLVFSYAKNKILFKDEPRNKQASLRETGRPINQPFGYESIGYYSEADVNAIKDFLNNQGSRPYSELPVAVPAYGLSVGETVQPGDLKYKDQNGDGVIDILDQKAIGNPSLPNTNLGLSLGVNYKGFSVNVLFQGSLNYSFAILGTGIEPFQSQFQPIHMQRWTPATAATAAFPRLSQNSTKVSSPSAYFSDYWLINAYYVRLKTVDIGYQLPTNMLPFKLNNARIYMSAYNLFTWTNFKKYQQDPEVSTNTAGDAYINQRVVNLGLQVGF
jgi:TonB-linked SusC/RagA family outer membrane protein